MWSSGKDAGMRSSGEDAKADAGGGTYIIEVDGRPPLLTPLFMSNLQRPGPSLKKNMWCFSVRSEGNVNC